MLTWMWCVAAPICIKCEARWLWPCVVAFCIYRIMLKSSLNDFSQIWNIPKSSEYAVYMNCHSSKGKGKFPPEDLIRRLQVEPDITLGLSPCFILLQRLQRDVLVNGAWLGRCLMPFDTLGNSEHSRSVAVKWKGQRYPEFSKPITDLVAFWSSICILHSSTLYPQ